MNSKTLSYNSFDDFINIFEEHLTDIKFEIKDGNVLAMHPIGEFHYSTIFEAKYLFKNIFMNDEYLKHQIIVNQGDTIFDVGANIGMFIMFMNYLVPKDLNIIAFEPIPKIFSILKKNISKLQLEKHHTIDLYNFGVTSKSGPKTSEFRYYEQASIASTMKIDTQNAGDGFFKESGKSIFQGGIPIECKLLYLSEIINSKKIKKVDLLKIDVEGAELDVLDGINENHWPFVKQIVMEIHNKNGLMEYVETFLKSKGFSRVLFEKPELIVQAGLEEVVNSFTVYATR